MASNRHEVEVFEDEVFEDDKRHGHFEDEDRCRIAKAKSPDGAQFGTAASPKPFPGLCAAAAAATSPTKYTSAMPVLSKCPEIKLPLPQVVTSASNPPGQRRRKT